jgi:hypothetical protein
MKLMRLRFTIRDLLWLTALVAMGVGWWVNSHFTLKGPRYRIADDGSWIDCREGLNVTTWVREGDGWERRASYTNLR